MIQLRNPWGFRSWNGDWSNKSELWTPQIRYKFKQNFNRDPISGVENGLFWISYKDFLKFFYTFDVCKILSNWMEARMTGYFISHEFRDIQAYQLNIFETTQIEMSLFQRSDTSRRELIDSDLMLLVFLKKRPHLPFITSSGRFLKRSINKDNLFEAGEYTILPLSFNFWYTANKVSYNLAIHGAKPFLLEQDILPYYILSDAIISFAINAGEKFSQEKKSSLYIVYENFIGILVVAENTDPKKYLHVEINAQEAENIVSTRQSLITIDSVPPLNRQVVILLTQLESSEGYKLSYTYKTEFKSEQSFSYENEKDIMNFPRLNRYVVGLHSPRLIN